MTAVPFAAYGDSTTSRETSWLPHVDPDSARHVGGVAVAGKTSGEILALVKTPTPADVTVIMLGTNDVRLGLTRATTKSNIDAIVKASGATRVLLCAIAPSDETDYGDAHLDRRTLGYSLNRDFAQFAADRGYLFADPWSAVRVLSNGWAKGASDDKTHPTDATSSTYTGPRMSLYIRQARSGAHLITNGA